MKKLLTVLFILLINASPIKAEETNDIKRIVIGKPGCKN
jgi:hypothetical protein